MLISPSTQLCGAQGSGQVKSRYRPSLALCSYTENTLPRRATLFPSGSKPCSSETHDSALSALVLHFGESGSTRKEPRLGNRERPGSSVVGGCTVLGQVEPGGRRWD